MLSWHLYTGVSVPVAVVPHAWRHLEVDALRGSPGWMRGHDMENRYLSTPRPAITATPAGMRWLWSQAMLPFSPFEVGDFNAIQAQTL